MPTQELQQVNKETQKLILKTALEFPTLSIDELTTLINKRGKKVIKDEVVQSLSLINPELNWYKSSDEIIQKQILEYLWTLEAQILFLLPPKQKETTLAEFNQIRLQNKQTKVPKDVLRHTQLLLMVDAKNLSKFRKFQKDLSIPTEVDQNTLAIWFLRIFLAEIVHDSVKSIKDLSSVLTETLRERIPSVYEKLGKSVLRTVDKFIERYFQKNISDSLFTELLTKYQEIFKTSQILNSCELSISNDLQDQNRLIIDIVDELNNMKETILKSHEGGFLGKLFSGSLKNKEGLINKVEGIISSLTELSDLNTKTNKSFGEKILAGQKVQNDYENIIIQKNVLENELLDLTSKFESLKESNSTLESESSDKSTTLEKAHEKIALLQQKVDQLLEAEEKAKALKEDLNIAKDLTVRLYKRVTRIKTDLKQGSSSKPVNGNGKAPSTAIEPVVESVNELN